MHSFLGARPPLSPQEAAVANTWQNDGTAFFHALHDWLGPRAATSDVEDIVNAAAKRKICAAALIEELKQRQ